MSGIDALALRLTEVQRAVDVGNAEARGQLALLVQRSDQAQLALAEQRRWAEGEFARHERELAAEEHAREKADRTLSAEVAALRTRAAMYSGVGITLAAIGGTLLGHYLPH